MLLHEKEMLIPRGKHQDGQTLETISNAVLERLPNDEIPVRFVVTCTDDEYYHCELGVLSGIDIPRTLNRGIIFDSKKRTYENTDQFNAVLIVPTGIGAEIGGHSGDAGPIARLLASCCDNLITHPNVVNAADINELPDNGLYVEGSVISRFLMGTIGLQRVRANRVILIIDKHEDKIFYESAINAVSAARATLGLDCPDVIMMDDKMVMRSLYSTSGRAVGTIDYFERICGILEKYRSQYDAVALSSVIRVPMNFHTDYYHENMINPWGGVEAMLTHTISLLYDVPSAHSPMYESQEIMNLDLGIIDPRKAAEIVSVTFLHCILKGLHKSPRIVKNIESNGGTGVMSVADVSCLIIPDKCVGLPTLAALEQGIPVIAVKENRNRMQNRLDSLPFEKGKLIFVDNYLEAAGVMRAIKAGVSIESLRRPLTFTNVIEESKGIQLKNISPEMKYEEKAARSIVSR
jgi:hypothetical protein